MFAGDDYFQRLALGLPHTIPTIEVALMQNIFICLLDEAARRRIAHLLATRTRKRMGEGCRCCVWMDVECCVFTFAHPANIEKHKTRLSRRPLARHVFLCSHGKHDVRCWHLDTRAHTRSNRKGVAIPCWLRRHPVLRFHHSSSIFLLQKQVAPQTTAVVKG